MVFIMDYGRMHVGTPPISSISGKVVNLESDDLYLPQSDRG